MVEEEKRERERSKRKTGEKKNEEFWEELAGKARKT